MQSLHKCISSTYPTLAAFAQQWSIILIFADIFTLLSIRANYGKSPILQDIAVCIKHSWADFKTETRQTKINFLSPAMVRG
jgi:hypothetical protein